MARALRRTSVRDKMMTGGRRHTARRFRCGGGKVTAYSAAGTMQRRAFCSSWHTLTEPERHGKETRMQIECTTTIAAAEVVSILLSAYLWPGREFRIDGPCPPGTPVHVTLNEIPAHVLCTGAGHP